MTSGDVSILRRELMQAEGFRSSAYADSLGFWTIGFGRLIDERKRGGISREEGELLLSNDISAAVRDCERTFSWFQALDPVRQRVIVEMRFQMGLGTLLEFTQTLPFIERGEYGNAAAAMLASKWSKQVPRRVKRLAEMMRSGNEP